MDTPKQLLSASKLFKQGDKHLYSVSVKTLLKLTDRGIVVRWEQNRKEDKQRVAKIRQYQEKSRSVDGIISLGWLDGKLVCYDGNHRRLALTKELNNVLLIISVIWKCTNEKLEEEFDRINKAISVPRVYIDKSLVDVKEVFIDFVKSLETRYPTFVSASPVCKKPNFNRDTLTDDLLSIHKSKVFKHLSSLKLLGLVKKANKSYASEKYGFDKSSLHENILFKCKTYGLWLFSEDRTLDRSYLKKVLKDSEEL